MLLDNLEGKIGKYLNNGCILPYTRMDCYLSVAEEVTGRLLPDLLPVVKDGTIPEYEVFRRIQGSLNTRLTKKRKEWEERYAREDIPKPEQKYLNEYFGEVRFEIRTALLGEGISRKVRWAGVKRRLREISKGKSFMEDAGKIRNKNNKLVVKIERDLLHRQFFALRKKMLPGILQVSREGFEAEKEKVTEEVREVFRPLRRLAEVVNVNCDFDEETLRQEVATRMEMLLEEMETDPLSVSLDRVLRLLVDAILSVVDKDTRTAEEDRTYIFNPEFAPFMHTSVKIENYTPVYQCRFTNHRTGFGDDVHRYAYSEKYTNYTLSVYGPWNECECLAYGSEEERME